MPTQADLDPHHIHLLHIMCQPGAVQEGEYLWESDSVHDGILIAWMIAFTGWYRGKAQTLLPGFGKDIVALDAKLQGAYWEGSSTVFRPDHLSLNPF